MDTGGGNVDGSAEVSRPTLVRRDRFDYSPAPMVLFALLLAADTGALAGKVTLNGLAPKLANLPVTRDMKVCGTTKPDESLELTSGGGVKNTVIWLTDVPLPKDFTPGKQKLDQQQCMFVPHVLATPVGATVEVVNSDKALHSVLAQAGDVRLMNYTMPIPGHVVPTKLTREGIYRVSCDVHPWMRAWLLVLPTAAYAISGEDGTYRLADVPAGRHKVRFWHERLGEREAQIEIQPGRTATHDVQYNPR
jgi:plastocyanin